MAGFSIDTVVLIIQRALPEPHAGLLSGIVFGVRATLPKSLMASLISSGTLHIIALSGMNIAMISALANTTLLRYLRRPIANLASIILIIGFIFFVGPSPSSIRAALMGSISLVAVNFGRQIRSLWIWTLAIITMLLLNPLWIADISFQLSALATLGLIVFGPTAPSVPSGFEIDVKKHVTNIDHPHSNLPGEFMTVLKKSILQFAYDSIHTTLAAQVLTIPVLFFTFHRISLISPVANLFIGWLIMPVTIMGFLLVLAGIVLPFLTAPLAWIAWVLLSIMIRIIEITGSLPYAGIAW